MGKVSNAIRMLNYLNTGNKYSVKELSKKLEISERMVIYYKTELEEAGIPIETFMGPNGGYYIVTTKEQYNLFNKYDIQLFENIYNILDKEKYEYLNKFKKTIDKANHIRDISEEKSKYYIVREQSDEDKILVTLKESILNKKKINILYKNLNQEWQKKLFFQSKFLKIIKLYILLLFVN